MNELSHIAESMQGSQILELAEQIRTKIRQGDSIYNLTIGDFNPQVFSVPDALKKQIARAYESSETNYPNSNGLPELREAIAAFTQRKTGLGYPASSILVSSGARPLIYACYQTILDPGDKVIYPAPSWNNNFYTQIACCDHIMVKTRPEDKFMPTADILAPHIKDAGLLALCSPLNPTGTMFSEEQLKGICERVLEENKKRAGKRKPLYLMYDQIYSNLVYGEQQHVNPVGLFPEMRPYTIYIDGISKAFAATGLRLGWGFGPKKVLNSMQKLLAHIGSWASRPVQWGTAHFLNDTTAVDSYLASINQQLSQRLNAFYHGFQEMHAQGLPVDAIAPQAALYLTVKLDLYSYQTPAGKALTNGREVYDYLLNEAGVAMVPFYAFGLEETSPWHRLSVGTTRMEDIPEILGRLKQALEGLRETQGTFQ